MIRFSEKPQSFSLVKNSFGLACAILGLTICNISFCQDASPAAGSNAAGTQTIDTTPAVTVNGFTITRNQVLRELREANAGEQELSPQVIAHALRHLIRKQLVLAELQKGPAALGPSELKMETGKIQARLAETGTTLEKHVARSGATLEEFENELLWRTVWQRHLDDKISDESVAGYFDLHHSRFDGTQVNVDQVLWVFSSDDQPNQMEKMREQANSVHQRLSTGEISWSAAVAEFSMSPLAKKPGQSNQRWIGRRGPMPGPFTEAAFGLKPGEFSLPVETAIGLHIVRCVEIRPGDRKPGEVVTEVRAAMAADIFESIADSAGPSYPVSYSGRVPYLDANGKLTEPVADREKPDGKQIP